MTQPTLDACSRFPTDFHQEEELPEQTQQAQATTAGPYYSKRRRKRGIGAWDATNYVVTEIRLQINYCLTKYILEKKMCIWIGFKMAFQKHICSYSYAHKKSTFHNAT